MAYQNLTPWKVLEPNPEVNVVDTVPNNDLPGLDPSIFVQDKILETCTIGNQLIRFPLDKIGHCSVEGISEAEDERHSWIVSLQPLRHHCQSEIIWRLLHGDLA